LKVPSFEDIEGFRGKMAKINEQRALANIYTSLNKLNGLSDVAEYIDRYIQCGSSDFRDNLIAFWQNIGVVTAFIGAISVTVMLASPSRISMFADDDGHVQTFHSSQRIAQAYYAFWALTTFSCIGAVLVVTISLVHFNLMSNDEEMIWFLTKWVLVTCLLPQIFLVVGCFSMAVGCMLGSFLVGNNLTGIIVCCIGGFIVLFVLSLWLWMLAVNKQKQAISSKQIQEEFKKYFEENTNKKKRKEEENV
jgi:hypothetical protein